MIALGMSLVLAASGDLNDKSVLLKREQDIATKCQSEVRISTLPFKPEHVAVYPNTTPMISYTDKAGVHEAVFDELPAPFQGIFDQWAGFTPDQASGRALFSALPNPVSPGSDMKAFFAANYEKLGREPNSYGWFLLQSVILAYDEPPRSFQQTLDNLATYDFD